MKSGFPRRENRKSLKKGFHNFFGSTHEDVINVMQMLENAKIDMIKALLEDYKERERALLKKVRRL